MSPSVGDCAPFPPMSSDRGILPLSVFLWLMLLLVSVLLSLLMAQHDSN